MKRLAVVLSLISFMLSLPLIGAHADQKVSRKYNNVTPPDAHPYMLAVAQQIADNWKMEGNTESDSSQIASIVFKIMPDGKIKNVFFIDRSGNQALDDSAYKAVINASPTKPFPRNINVSYLEMGIRFTPDGVK